MVERKDGVTTITLNRPEVLNALNITMSNDLADALTELNTDDNTRVIVLTGAGRAFCAGADIKDWATSKEKRTPPQQRAELRQSKMLGSLQLLDKPVIAAVNGVAVGFGCNLALACDLRIASEKARFGELFILRGLVPDMAGMFYLPRIVGVAKAKELMFTGDIIDARTAEAIGLVNKTVPEEELEPAVMQLASKLASLPPAALAMTKVGIDRGLEMGVECLRELERLSQSICYSSEDHAESIQAYVEKREPKFKGG